MLNGLKALVVAAFFSASIATASPVNIPTVDDPLQVNHSRLRGSSDYLPAVRLQAIRKVRCSGGHGTGFVIDRNTIMTASHVVKGKARCFDDETGDRLTLVYTDEVLDIAVLRFTKIEASTIIRINCNGFQTGQTYYSLGFAGMGDADLMMTRLRAFAEFQNGEASNIKKPYVHMRALRGVIIPGMSGGPIIDDHGYVIGMNNLTSDGNRRGLSREMKDSYLCKR